MRRKKLLYSYVLLFDAKFFYRYTPVLFPHARRYEKEGRIHVSEKSLSFLPLQKLPQPRQSPHARPQSPLSKRRKPPKRKRTAHKGRPPLSPEIYVEFAGKQYNITDLVDRAKADYRLTHKVGVAVLQDLRQA